MIMRKILNMPIIKTVGCVYMALSGLSCHMVSTGTMIYDYKNERVVDFQPTPLLPGQYRENIIFASPQHSCFFTMQSVKMKESRYSLIRKKDYAGKILASYKLECGVYPLAEHFDFSPNCDRLLICNAYLHNETRVSVWSNLPQIQFDNELYLNRFSSILGADLFVDDCVCQKKNCLFLSKDVLLCILLQNKKWHSKKTNNDNVEYISTFYLATINLEKNKYSIIKEFRQNNDVFSTNTITTYDVILKKNEDDLVAILVGSKLYLYNYKDDNFVESIAIDELPMHHFTWLYPSFTWLNNDELVFWKKHDEFGNFFIFNVKTQERRKGALKYLIVNWLSEDICLVKKDNKIVILNPISGKINSLPARLGSNIYEVFWLKDGYLGFNCNF